LASRADAYAASLSRGYNEGFGMQGTSFAGGDGSDDTDGDGTSAPQVTIRWSLGQADHCDNCIDLADQEFTPDDLPGYPGDGGFGPDNSPLCLGGPCCDCAISLVYGDDTLATTDTSLGRQIALGQAPGADLTMSAATKDFALSSPLGSGFVPFDLTAGVGSVVPDPLAGRDVVERFADPASAQRMFDTGIYDHAEYEVVGNAICVKSVEASGVWHNSDGLSPDATEEQLQSHMLVDHHPTVHYTDIPVGGRDALDAMHAGLHSQHGEVGAHEALKRYLTIAEAKAGKIDETIDNGPPVSSSADLVQQPTQFAGLAVRAEDTGRCLLLQRAIPSHGDTDPAAGMWEFPGGHLDDSELPFAGAVREWQEEVGHTLPAGRVVSEWTCQNGYQGFVYSIDHETDLDLTAAKETVNPDGDMFEACAWWDPTELPTLASLRPELRQDFPASQLRTPVGAATKAAETDSDVEPESQPRMMGSSIDESEVFDYLSEHYPDGDLSFVSRCLWTSDNILLDQIDYENRPGGIDREKVADMAAKLDDGWQPHPVVLIAPDADSQMAVMDGFHRLNALAEAGQEATAAWVGSPKPGNTGWRADILACQFTVTNHPGDQ
jgi:8-oxo-dGTP pyrophosphatase MutT (NUDIX family)